MRVVILHDRIPDAGAGPDQTDALVQADAVASALEEMGHGCVRMGISLDLKAFQEEIKGLKADLVFNLVESVEGQGRFIHLAPAVLDSLGIPYTGSKTDAIYATSNKLLSKRLLEGGGIPAPRGFSLSDLQDCEVRMDGEYIVKSVWEHASVGIEEDAVLAGKPEGMLREAIRRKKALGGECFLEEYIDGREFNLSLLAGEGGPEILPPAEIRFDDFPPGKRRLVGYRAKWDEKSFEYRHTPRSFEFPPEDAPLLSRLKEIARGCWDLFALRGYARVDFRVDPQRGPLVLEINANPCLSPDAGFAAAADKGAVTFREVVRRILGDAAVG